MATVLNPPNGPMWTSPGAAPSVVSAAPTRRSRARSQWLILGAALTVLGFVAGIVIVVMWANRGFGTLSEERLAILAATDPVLARKLAAFRVKQTATARAMRVSTSKPAT
jgi:hypothetical protein